MDDSLKREKSR